MGPVGIDEEVCRLEVAMQHSSAVEVGDTAEDLPPAEFSQRREEEEERT